MGGAGTDIVSQPVIPYAVHIQLRHYHVSQYLSCALEFGGGKAGGASVHTPYVVVCGAFSRVLGG